MRERQAFRRLRGKAALTLAGLAIVNVVPFAARAQQGSAAAQTAAPPVSAQAAPASPTQAASASPTQAAAAATQTVDRERRTNTEQARSGDLTPIQVNGKWGYADNSGKIVIKPQFAGAREFSDRLALVWTEGLALTDAADHAFAKTGYIDRTGRWVIHSRWDYYFSYDFSEGLVPFLKQFGKWGYMDTTGKIVIRPRFDWAGSFSGGVAPALFEGKCSHIDKTGTVIDQSAVVLPHSRYEQDRHGTYRFKPQRPPCS